MMMKQKILSDKLINKENSISDHKKGIILVALAWIFFGLLQFHIKFTKILFDSIFDSNSFMVWRSISTAVIGYLCIKYNSIKILRYSEINNKIWFLIRTFGAYFALLFLVISITYLRVATASCISSISPAIMLILAVLILKEKLEIRYIIGILVCLTGATIIILNEQNNSFETNSTDQLDMNENNVSQIIIGTFFGILHVIFVALTSLSQKILAEEKFEVHNMIFYIGFSNFICAIVYSLIFQILIFDWKFVLFSSINSIFFYLSSYYLYYGLTIVNFSTMTPIYYASTLTVFICGVLILGEKIFLSDIIGSLIILAFNVYNSHKK